jgi:hypothetical protein
MAAIDEIRRGDRERFVAGDRGRFTAGERGRFAAGARGRDPERAARRTLRDQVARLERELGAIVTAAYPRLDPGPSLPALAGPRVLSLGDLERIRDALAARVGDLRAAAAEQAVRQAAAQVELERMLADPPAHKWRRLSNSDLGRPGCTTYHVRPRTGLLGMLMGWWEVKVSGGCPLAARNPRGTRSRS